MNARLLRHTYRAYSAQMIAMYITMEETEQAAQGARAEQINYSYTIGLNYLFVTVSYR